MRGNIFTGYIICNRLNLETFFKPIIDFIEIGKRIVLPLEEPYLKISSRTAQTKNQSIVLLGRAMDLKLCNQTPPFFFTSMRRRVIICGYNAKISSRLIDRYWPVESSIFLFNISFL